MKPDLWLRPRLACPVVSPDLHRVSAHRRRPVHPRAIATSPGARRCDSSDAVRSTRRRSSPRGRPALAGQWLFATASRPMIRAHRRARRRLLLPDRTKGNAHRRAPWRHTPSRCRAGSRSRCRRRISKAKRRSPSTSSPAAAARDVDARHVRPTRSAGSPALARHVVRTWRNARPGRCRVAQRRQRLNGASDELPADVLYRRGAGRVFPNPSALR